MIMRRVVYLYGAYPRLQKRCLSVENHVEAHPHVLQGNSMIWKNMGQLSLSSPQPITTRPSPIHRVRQGLNAMARHLSRSAMNYATHVAPRPQPISYTKEGAVAVSYPTLASEPLSLGASIGGFGYWRSSMFLNVDCRRSLWVSP